MRVKIQQLQLEGKKTIHEKFYKTLMQPSIMIFIQLFYAWERTKRLGNRIIHSLVHSMFLCNIYLLAL